MSGSTERKVTRIKEINQKLRDLESKYGMSYRDFYNYVEGDMSTLLQKFDVEEVMDDLERLISLLDEKEELLKSLGKRVNLFSELDEGWTKIFP